MNLSANFTLMELTKSEAAIRLDIDNSPNEEQIESLRLLCENILQPVRDHFGKPVKISSGFRCAELNSSPAVGGSKTSDHCKGQAVDFEIDGLSNPDVAQWIMDNLEYTQLILEFYVQGQPNSGWIHCSFDPNNLKKQELTATKVAGKTTYLNGLVA
jgi:zinc D-Ala-D-Ala carboxypeptidase